MTPSQPPHRLGGVSHSEAPLKAITSVPPDLSGIGLLQRTTMYFERIVNDDQELSSMDFPGILFSLEAQHETSVLRCSLKVHQTPRSATGSLHPSSVPERRCLGSFNVSFPWLSSFISPSPNLREQPVSFLLLLFENRLLFPSGIAGRQAKTNRRATLFARLLLSSTLTSS